MFLRCLKMHSLIFMYFHDKKTNKKRKFVQAFMPSKLNIPTIFIFLLFFGLLD